MSLWFVERLGRSRTEGDCSRCRPGRGPFSVAAGPITAQGIESAVILVKQ
jgi:hypothetical protein